MLDRFLPQDASLMDMNSLSPMMPTSPLSMINQVKFEDEPDLKDLFITVDDPESHVTTLETFITYRVLTKVSRGRTLSGAPLPSLSRWKCLLSTLPLSLREPLLNRLLCFSSILGITSLLHFTRSAPDQPGSGNSHSFLSSCAS